MLEKDTLVTQREDVQIITRNLRHDECSMYTNFYFIRT